MKTYKNLYQKLYSHENLYLAYKKARKRKTKKIYVLKFEQNLKENLLSLQQELINKTYSPHLLKQFIIRDPKTRKISKSIFKDRIVHHIIVNILEPVYEPIFIYDSYASRKGKGQHKALERFDYFKRKVSKNGRKLLGIKDKNYVCGYALKIDIAKYFETINHEILINILRRKIKDENIIWLITKIIKNGIVERGGTLEGLPLGNYTSQFFANIYLNELDQFAKHTLKARYYIRYVDDIVILHNSKYVLERYKEEIIDFLKNLKLQIHPSKSRIIPLHQGVPLLGFRIFYFYKLLKEANLNQIKQRLEQWEIIYNKKLTDYTNLISKLEGWLAHAKHGKTFNLRTKIISEFNKKFSFPLSNFE